MNIKHLDELKQLPDMIRGLPKGAFDLLMWVNPCGTIACTIGHGILNGTISGMTLAESDDPDGDKMVLFGKLEDGDAIAAYFGIRFKDVQYLFSPVEYRSAGNWGKFTDREAVATRIEQFIAQHAPADPVRRIEMKSDLPAPREAATNAR